MPTTCTPYRYYYGDVGPIDKLYAGDTLVWPCFNCTPDPEYARPEYGDALMYVPEVCTPVIAGPLRISDAKSLIDITQGPAWNGLFNYGGATYGFFPQGLSDLFGEVLAEADLPAVTGKVGSVNCSVSFYIELIEDLTGDEPGLFLKFGEMEIELKAGDISGTLILARVPHPTGGDPIVLEGINLVLNNRVRVIVTYEAQEVPTYVASFKMYYNYDLVGQVTI